MCQKCATLARIESTAVLTAYEPPIDGPYLPAETPSGYPLFHLSLARAHARFTATTEGMPRNIEQHYKEVTTRSSCSQGPPCLRRARAYLGLTPCNALQMLRIPAQSCMIVFFLQGASMHRGLGLVPCFAPCRFYYAAPPKYLAVMRSTTVPACRSDLTRYLPAGVTLSRKPVAPRIAARLLSCGLPRLDSVR